VVQGRADTGFVRITIWVRPGSSRPAVGGGHDGALVVRVSAKAVDGQATAAALAAVAAAFGVRRRAVTLVAGGSSRTKIVDVPHADPAVLDRLLALPTRGQPPPGAP
jgi:MYXO-CTERM domain-containing protein